MTAAVLRGHGATRRHVDATSLSGRLAVACIGAAFAAPGVFVVWRATHLGAPVGSTLRDLAAPAWRSAQLTALVSATCAVVGTALAWLVTMTSLPGRRVWRFVLVMPLALPSFVGATAILSGFTPGGVLHHMVAAIGIDPPRRIRGLLPAWLMLSAFSYPFVMLPVMGRLRSLPASHEETATLLGLGRLAILWRVTLPQIRSAVVGGTLIVALYMMSEFGAVQLFGFDTLTRVIYATRQVDRATSFMAAAMLFAASIGLVTLVRRTERNVAIDQRVSLRPPAPARLGRWTPVALAVCSLAAGIGVLAPVLSLGAWALRGIREQRIDWSGFAQPALNSASTGLIAAAVTLLAVWPVASAAVRRRDPVAKAAGIAVVSGFALPSLVVALSLAILALNTPLLDRWYQTFPLLIVAHAAHFGSQALASAEQSVRAVSPHIREASRLLERSPWRRWFSVDLPLMRPTMMSGGGLVMLAVIKELPATLLLSPLGFRTLSTEIWASFEEGFLADAAVGSLVLVSVSAVLSWALIFRDGTIGYGGERTASTR
jgi:iron(III) transport system permease protein